MIYINERSNGKNNPLASLAEQFNDGGEDDNHNDYDDDANINNNANICIAKTDISVNIIADDSVLIFFTLLPALFLWQSHSPFYEINQN